MTWALFLTAKSLRAYFEVRLASAGSSLATYRTLDEIDRGGGRNQDQLARAMGIEGATLTRHLDRMEADGLILRRRDPDDRRASIVEATAAGRRLHGRLKGVAAAADEQLWNGTSERERTRLRDVLAAVRSNAARIMLVELSVVEQRYQAGRGVLRIRRSQRHPSAGAP